jgi:hypothetical protein
VNDLVAKAQQQDQQFWTSDKRVLAVIAAQVLIWTLVPLLVHSSPPLDVVESFVWGRELVPATFKHPNGPGLLLELSRRLALGGLWLGPLVSQIAIAAAFWAVYQLGRLVLPQGQAVAGAMLLTGVYYYSWPTPEFNHNVLPIPCWALLWLSTWKAVETRRLVWWMALGAAGAAAMWGKYSSVLALLTVLVWVLSDAKGRETFKTVGPYLAALVFLVLVSPQILYLLKTDFLPLTYFSTRSQTSDSGALSFAGAQIIDHLPMLIVAASIGLVGRGMWVGGPLGRERRFLLLAGLLPFFLTLVISLTGANLKSMWGTPMFNLSGLLFLAFLGGRWKAGTERKVLISAAVLLALVPAGYAINHIVTYRTAQKPLRTQYPMEAISSEVRTRFEEETGAPLRLVAGDIFSAGLVALPAERRIGVLIDGDFIKAPWIEPGRLDEEGLVLLWETRREPAETLTALIGDRPVESFEVPWSKNPEILPLNYSYVVVPPAEAP